MKALMMYSGNVTWVIHTTATSGMYNIVTINPEADSIENMVVEEKNIPGEIIRNFVDSKNKISWERERDWEYALLTSQDIQSTQDNLRDYEWGVNLIDTSMISRDALKESTTYNEANESLKAQVANYITSTNFLEALRAVDGDRFT